MTQPPLSERAQGRWGTILPAIGIDRSYLTGKNGPCPMCAGRDRWRYINRNGSGDWWCNACGHGNGVDLVKLFLKTDFFTAAKRIEEFIGSAPLDKDRPKLDEKKLRQYMQRVWDSGVPIHGTPAETYLNNRGIYPDISRAHIDLRYTESTPYDRETKLPAMLAKVTNKEGKPVNIHRTYLTLDGRKADVEPVRKMMAGTVPPGAAIRLWHHDGSGILGIAEGIETAFHAKHRFCGPIWSVISSGGIRRFEVPAGIKRLVIFGDADTNFDGQSAAYTLANRITIQSKGEIAVEVEIPPALGTDWADEIFHVEPQKRRFGSA